jgi:hypothetical protein
MKPTVLYLPTQAPGYELGAEQEQDESDHDSSVLCLESEGESGDSSTSG